MYRCVRFHLTPASHPHPTQVLTSTWSDGQPGPLAYCVPEGRLTHEKISSYNQAHKGTSMIVTSGTKSHFMSAETLNIIMEQLYSPAFARQRAKHLGFNQHAFLLTHCIVRTSWVQAIVDYKMGQFFLMATVQHGIQLNMTNQTSK